METRLPGTVIAGLAHLVIVSTSALAQPSAITFTERAHPENGIVFERVPSARHADALALYQDSVANPIVAPVPGLLPMPTKSRGLPGVAVLDADLDGDLDIFVTNGPGAANALFSNLWVETGTLAFVDVAALAGVEATARDSSGVCFGDIDNDDDPDLLVTTEFGSPLLFANNGDGTFTDASAAAGFHGGRSASSCAMGDVDNDGLLDVIIGRSFNHDTLEGIFPVIPFDPFGRNFHNELYLNQGDGSFLDVSAEAGMHELGGVPPGAATITWALAFVDHDQDGDVDLWLADDQGGLPRPPAGAHRGFIQIFENDGTGVFETVSEGLGLTERGESWMGLSFADFDRNGTIDVFGSNFGDYFIPLLSPTSNYQLGEQASRWLLQNTDGTFADEGVGDLVASVFGWGTSAEDFDNDGDTDIVFHGGLDMHGLVTLDNPGALLINDGSADFSFDPGRFATNHAERNVQGVASGDLNLDGFVDVVSVANEVIPSNAFPVVPFAAVGISYGSPFDSTGFFAPRFGETSPGSRLLSWLGFDYPNGDLSIEINNGETGHRSVSVTALGTIGITTQGRVNRSGIGAVFAATPKGLATAIKPVLGGGSFLSQDSLTQTFGLGRKHRATIDVLWPGGIRNRYLKARAGEHLVFPEIPCDPAASWPDDDDFEDCVEDALAELVAAGVISSRSASRFEDGMDELFEEFQDDSDSDSESDSDMGSDSDSDTDSDSDSDSDSDAGPGDRITFSELTGDPAIDGYARSGSTTVALAETLHQDSLIEPVSIVDVAASPMMPRGLPGVAVLDFDNDDDLDLYVTNGPNASNSLMRSLLSETGQLSFVDVAVAAGVAATDQDSFGTCFGDLDNDGDHDLLVLGRKEPNRLFENLGDGTFAEIPGSGAGGGTRTSTSCSMGDFNGDGLLDIVVANSFDMTESFAIFFEPYALNEHNQLFINQGGLAFSDQSDASGITVNGGYPPGAAGITWAVGSADLDLDGDLDIVFADDQGAIIADRFCDLAPPGRPCLDRAYLHAFLNDGTGHFVDAPLILNEYSASEWMGVSFGDLNCDGSLDLFGSTFGDYGNPVLSLPYQRGASASRWLLGNGDGTFTDPGVGDLLATPFGWGSGIFDYDNDGDLDIIYHGGLDAGNLVVISDNPGAVLENQNCSASFVADTGAITTDHLRRNARGVAVGDLDRNGFVDVATVANQVSAPPTPLVPAPAAYGSAFDNTAFFAPIMFPAGPPENPGFVWGGVENGLGNLKVELNNGENGNRSATVRLVGSVGLTPQGRVNRDGIGAVISSTPKHGETVMQPVVGGSSHSSQHALEKIVGMGDRDRATVEVLWPGGVRNRLYGLEAGERLVFPEIPCSFDGDWRNRGRYLACVIRSLNDLVSAGVLDHRSKLRFLRSARRAYDEHR